jgi:hypothetical protein
MLVTILIPLNWLGPLGLPEHLHDSVDEAGRIGKEALLHALKQPVDATEPKLALPAPVEAGRNHRVSINIPSAPASVLQFLASGIGLTPGPTAKRLIGLVARAQIERPQPTAPDQNVLGDHPLAVLNRKMGLEPRAAQAQLYDNLWESLGSGHIGMVEGGTGIGKTRAMLAAAVRWVRERELSIGICAPTIALLRQMVEEHQRQHDVDPELPKLRLLIGRNEFVSESELRAFIASRGAQWDTPEVRDWLANGVGPNDHDGLLDTSWQTHSLLQIAPDMPLDEVRLSDINQASDRGFLAYRRQFDRKEEGNTVGSEREKSPPAILLFTHAMLAQDMRRKLVLAGQDETYSAMQAFFMLALRNVKGKKRPDFEDDFEAIAVLESEMGVALNTAVDGKTILPAFFSLMVDEGHMLEESLSSSLSEYLSIRSLLQDLKAFKALGGRVSADGVGLVERAIDNLIQVAPQVERRDFVALSGDGEGRLTSQLSAIATVCATVSQVRDTDSEKFRLSLKIRRAGILLDSAVNRNRNNSFLRHSPIKHLPQLMVSNSNVRTVLSRLWSSLESAALVSATLYIPTIDGPSPTFMGGLLQVPLSRLKSFAPVSSHWSTSCVQGVWVTQSRTDWLYPPTSTTQGRKRTAAEHAAVEVQWHEDLAIEIEKIWKSAAGGVLVLCTSYATVQAVSALLANVDTLSESFVTAVSRVSVRSQSQEFLTHSHQGRKPLWLGVGSAWTGVDIGGHDPWKALFGTPLKPEHDNVLTDLVIPRLPYGTNQSLSHLWRIRNNPNVPWDLLDASLRFKQALGRLVRRDGLAANRRIFVLDARMGDPDFKPRLVPFTKSLTNYRQHDHLNKPTH